MRNMLLLTDRLRKAANCLLLCGLSLSGAFAQVGPPPVITVQPLSQTVKVHGSVTFRVVATSATTMTYRWYHDGQRISGADQSAYTIGDVTLADRGRYSVRVINASGSVMSSNALLTVLVPPGITTGPQSQTVTAGETASFSVVASGTAPLRYQWTFNGAPLAGANNSTLTLTNVQTAQAGNYSVMVTNLYGSATSAVAILTVRTPPVITTQPQSQSVVQGQDVALTVEVTGTDPFVHWWYFDGSLVLWDGFGRNSTLTLNNVQPADAGSYMVVVDNFVGSVTSAVATLIVNVPPSITIEPVSQTVAMGQSASFSVVASGTAPLSYQWNHDGAAIADATNSNLTLTNVQPAEAGRYTVVVANFVGSVTSVEAALIVNVPPFITTEPQSQTVAAGEKASFSVEAGGTAPLNYQWRFNGAPLQGDTKSTLTLNNVWTNDAGSYSVVVMNSAGSVTSAVAALIVNVPPLITTEPQSQSVTVGQSASFSVVASGTTPLSYQWNLDGMEISDATNSVLTLTNVQRTDAGDYTVVVTNSVGSVTSASAKLTVTDPPCSTPPYFVSSRMTAGGFTFQLSVSIGCTYVLLASTDLTAWTAIATNVALAETLEVTDSTATNRSLRFYRLMTQ